MNNKKGQSLVDVVFAIGMVVLVLTGVVVLMVSTAKMKRLSLERQKAVELSQRLIEDQTLNIKKDPSFWSNLSSLTDKSGQTDPNFPDYTYDVGYSGCVDPNCKISFSINWGDSPTPLKVEKLYTRQGI